MKKEAILFDLDGTLVNSRESIVQAVYDTTEEYSPGATTVEEIKSKFGAVYSDDLIAINPELKEEILGFYSTKINDAYLNEVTLFPFVKEGLTQLKQAGFRLGIVTNQTSELTEIILQRCEVLNFMECIITVDQVSKGKPDPEPILTALSKLSLSREAVVMVGDSNYDIAAANQAGVTSILLDNYRLFEEVTLQADMTFRRFEEFTEALLHITKEENITS